MRLLRIALTVAVFLNSLLFAAATPASVSLIVLDPFLVGANHLNNMQLSTFLASNPNLSSFAANALSADGASATIVLLQTDSNEAVTFTVNSAVTLDSYADNFLTTAPATGQSSLTVTNLIQVGSSYFAPALLQGPLGGYSDNNNIQISASQGNTKAGQNLALVIPPLVLVHGLWGDKKSLSEAESYMRGHAPWKAAPEFVQPICYSKYLRFDAKKDPLSNVNDPCEVTSKAAVQTEIDSLMAVLDDDGIVGARIDLLVHSMGGLVARNYASQTQYDSTRNRMQGQFHAIVTLNTPEIGSTLAPFLISKRNARRKAPLWTPQGLIWDEVCGNTTVDKCFYANGYPIHAPSLPVNTGAVFSLDPDGKSLNNPNLSGPNIVNATWRAVSSTRPGNSALALGLDTLIAALYHNPFGNNVPTVDSILGNVPDDAIVTLTSQTTGAKGNQLYTFAKLSHNSLVNSILTWLTGGQINDNSVTSDPSREVEKLAACWIATTGSDTCRPAGIEIAETSPPVTPTMLKPLGRLLVQAPDRSVLGGALIAQIRLPVSGPGLHLAVYQSGETGRVALEPVPTMPGPEGTVEVQIIPKLLGPVRFGVQATFVDGSVAAGTFQSFVAPPAMPPVAFRANDLPILVLTLNSDTADAMPHPSATWPAPVGTIDLNARFVSWKLFPQQGPAVIRVDRNGYIHAVEPGEARVQAHFGGAKATLRVLVRATQQ